MSITGWIAAFKTEAEVHPFIDMVIGIQPFVTRKHGFILLQTLELQSKQLLPVEPEIHSVTAVGAWIQHARYWYGRGIHPVIDIRAGICRVTN